MKQIPYNYFTHMGIINIRKPIGHAKAYLICESLSDILQLIGFGKLRPGDGDGLDYNIFIRMVVYRIAVYACDPVDNIHALDDHAECRICAVKVRSIRMHDKELTACAVIGLVKPCH